MDRLKKSITEIADIYSTSIQSLIYDSFDSQLMRLLFLCVDFIKVLQRLTKEKESELFGSPLIVDIRHSCPVTTSFDKKTIITLVTHLIWYIANNHPNIFDRDHLIASIPLIAARKSPLNSIVLAYYSHVPI